MLDQLQGRFYCIILIDLSFRRGHELIDSNFHFRYGQHFLAAIIYEKLSSNISLEKLHFFLNGLSQISKAECILNYGCDYHLIEEYYKKSVSSDSKAKKIESNLTLAERLEKAVTFYWKALATLKVISS